MGANIVNTIAENTASYIIALLDQGNIGLRILSNLCTERMTMAEFNIETKHLAWKGYSGEDVARKMV
jgi:hydroxymethylglutaryl-CoA reductase